jgi:hypothetical protein
VATAAGLAALVLTAPSSAEEACGEDECVRLLGEWIEMTLVREWPIYTLAVWVLAVALVARLHRSNVKASALRQHPE